jgi:hypothetical protein
VLAAPREPSGRRKELPKRLQPPGAALPRKHGGGTGKRKAHRPQAPRQRPGPAAAAAQQSSEETDRQISEPDSDVSFTSDESGGGVDFQQVRLVAQRKLSTQRREVADVALPLLAS